MVADPTAARRNVGVLRLVLLQFEMVAKIGSALLVDRKTNAVDLVRLRELAAGGVAIVPTLWIEHAAAAPGARLAAQGWDEVVVKPAVSIGAIGALRTRASRQMETPA